VTHAKSHENPGRPGLGFHPSRLPDDFRSWFAFYYKAPHPERVTASLRFMKRHKYLDEYPDIASIFLSHVMAANPDRIPGWLDTEWRDLGETEWSVILIALWMSDTKDSRALIGRYLDRAEPAHRSRIRDLQDQTPEHIDPLKTEIVDPRQINLVWAAFSATGDERYVRRVIDEVHNYGAVRNETEAAIGEAAIMTLANNALQHDVVAKLCDRLDNTHPDAKTRILLKAMLNALADVAKENGIDLPAH
jgi:hypothetical protein